MVDLNELYRGRREEIAIELTAIKEQIRKLEENKKRLYEELLVADQDDETLKKARHLYWRTKTKVTEIATLLHLPGRSYLAQIIGPGSSGLKCTGCSREYVFHNRDEARSKAHDHWSVAWKIRKEGIFTHYEQRCKTLCVDCQKNLIDRLNQLIRMPYQEYLKTPEWQEKRAIMQQRSKRSCQLCNATGTLDVHHRTYERRGLELVSDLFVLCRACHAKHHGIENEVPA